MAKRKLTKILRSKATRDTPINSGDIVQIYIKEQNSKRGTWSAPNVVLAMDKVSGTVTVPGKKGRQIKAAVEDARAAATEDTFALRRLFKKQLMY